MIRQFVLTLIFCLGAVSASAFDFAKMSAAEREEFNAAVRAYLLQNPEVIFEAVEIYEQRQANAQAASDVELLSQYEDEIFNDNRSWVGGNPDGDVTVVEFLDYRCGYCKKAFAEVEDLIANDKNIRLVIKEFPILGDQSTLASRFAIAVRNTSGFDAYKAVHDDLIQSRGQVNIAGLRRIANAQSLNFDAILVEMDNPAVQAEIRENYALAQTLNITGTPSFVFKTEMMRGYAPADTMRAIIAQIRG